MTQMPRNFPFAKGRCYVLLRTTAFLLSLWVLQTQCANADGTATVSVSATVLSKSVCKFQGITTQALAFGNIDPSSSANATATASLTLICHGSANPATYALNHDSGLYKLGPNQNRMKHSSANEYLPYSLNLTPSSGTVSKNVSQTVTITGTVTPAQFQDAASGSYSDTVIITLSP